jgi:carboxypeptidase Taq
MAQTPYQQLEQEFRRLHAFRGAASVLRWDAAVMMPRGSASVRGEQLAALASECHALLTSPRVSRLIERAQASESQLEDWQLANLREMRRERDHAIATPSSLVSRLARATAVAEVRWLEAKQESNFALFEPHLEEVIALTRDKAQVLSQALGLSPYDALIDGFSPGFLSAEIEQLFRVVSRRLPSLIRDAIELQAERPPLPLTGKVSTAKQRSLAVDVMRSLGFPFDRGRLDESDHPFTEGVNGDVRVTTRFVPQEPFTGLMGVLHETGQAMYDLGLPEAWRDQPVGRDRGMALEESQSLLLEMIIGRSRPFLAYLRPLLEKHFGVTGPAWEPDNLYRTLIRVRRAAIRVDADESPIALEDRVKEQCFLAFREALSNALRHAQASRILVVLRVRPQERLTLVVIDDGVGEPSAGARRQR